MGKGKSFLAEAIWDFNKGEEKIYGLTLAERRAFFRRGGIYDMGKRAFKEMFEQEFPPKKAPDIYSREEAALKLAEMALACAPTPREIDMKLNTPKEMKMKVEFEEREKTGRKYPWIGEWDDGCVVLFTSRDKGFRLDCAGRVGCYSERWCEANFTPYRGKITLSND